MASSYSTDLKIELMVTGENAGTWGDKTNDNLNVIQQAIAGYGEQSIAGGAQTTALTIANSPTLSVARNIVIKLTGVITGNQIVTVPTGIEKTYIIANGTTGAFTVQFKTTDAGSTGTTWSATDKAIKILYSNGTEISPADLSTLSGTVASASIANQAITIAKLNSFAVTTARLATNAVTGVKITQSTITQSKLAANSVGSNQLISTGVVADSYNRATITVDADGRITSANTTASSAGMEIPTRYSVGPTSGIHTASPTANRLGVYMIAGGGGGGGGNAASGPDTYFAGTGGPGGGNSGFGFYNKPIAQPFSQPFAVGGGGGTSTSGGNTSITNVGTVNAGGGGPTATAGNAPAADLTYPIRRFVVGGPSSGFGVGGSAGSPGTNGNIIDPESTPNAGNPGNPGSPGAAGVLVVFENTGT